MENVEDRYLSPQHLAEMFDMSVSGIYKVIAKMSKDANFRKDIIRRNRLLRVRFKAFERFLQK